MCLNCCSENAAMAHAKTQLYECTKMRFSSSSANFYSPNQTKVLLDESRRDLPPQSHQILVHLYPKLI